MLNEAIGPDVRLFHFHYKKRNTNGMEPPYDQSQKATMLSSFMGIFKAKKEEKEKQLNSGSPPEMMSPKSEQP